MNEVNSVFEAIKFMFLGMGTVFIFLTILIGAMNLQSKILTKYFLKPQIPPIDETTEEKINANKIAAITAAIIHHKNTN